MCGLSKEVHQFNTERLSAESSSWGSFELSCGWEEVNILFLCSTVLNAVSSSKDLVFNKWKFVICI